MFSRVEKQLGEVDLLFLPSADSSTELKGLLKELYDASAGISSSWADPRQFGSFDSLVVDGLDSETIYEELRSRNGPLTKFIKRRMAKIDKDISAQSIKQDSAADHVDSESGSDHDEQAEEQREVMSGDEVSDEEDEGDEEDSQGMQLDKMSEDSGANSNSGQDDVKEKEFDDDADADPNDEKGGEFLDEMSDWLDQQEDREETHRNKMDRLDRMVAQKGAVEEGDSDDEEDDEQFAARELYDDDEENDDGGDSKNASFKDFFGKEKKSKQTKKQNFDIEEGDEEEDDEDDGDEFEYPEEEEEEEVEEEGDKYEKGDKSDSDSESDPDDESDNQNLSSYKKQQLKKRKEIKELEADLMGAKSWDLKGEVAAKDRPENSLLEVSVDIERASKPAPIVTQEYTSSIEEMIIKRIKDSKYDDVTIPDTPEVRAGEDFVLSQEKSRAGLGEIYADDFMAKAKGAESDEKLKEDDSIVEIKSLFHKVCRELDGLSHFHYSPRPIIAEASVSTVALPSISMEDIIPTTESLATTAAPEDIRAKKRGRSAALMADAELTSDDKKRLRQASKASRRKERKESKYNETLASHSGKSSNKFESQKTDEILRSDRRVVEGTNEDTNQYTKSSQFFSALQQNAQSIISGASLKKKKEDKINSSKEKSSKFKL